jgi:hypothetical protein
MQRRPSCRVRLRAELASHAHRIMMSEIDGRRVDQDVVDDGEDFSEQVAGFGEMGDGQLSRFTPRLHGRAHRIWHEST